MVKRDRLRSLVSINDHTNFLKIFNRVLLTTSKSLSVQLSALLDQLNMLTDPTDLATKAIEYQK